jgi:hypothetical protein
VLLILLLVYGGGKWSADLKILQSKNHWFLRFWDKVIYHMSLVSSCLDKNSWFLIITNYHLVKIAYLEKTII